MNRSNERTDLAAYLFHQGTNFHAQDYLGFHRGPDDGDGAATFRTWAPRADAVTLVGDAFGWDDGVPMTRVTDGGVWEAAIPNASDVQGTFYKYRVTHDGESRLKADPYAFAQETLGKTASIAYPLPDFDWHDEAWMKHRAGCFGRVKGHYHAAPLNIYEMHLGSWRTRNGQSTANGDNYLNYREIAAALVPYVKEMGFTHVELLPVMEHPYDGSWGYQITGYFAPTARYGTPEDFMAFVDALHSAGVGVILDWVGAHFPKDDFALVDFDGSPTYEYQGADRMEHRGWGTRCFDVGRPEVQSFLISNALFWLDRYHADGLRVDAVASMLYLDYDRRPGEWTPNPDGSNISREAVAFLRKLNSAVFERHPDALMIAEESTAFPLVTKPADEGGLGFNFKWNMGWANDMYSYVAADPFFRGKMHDKLTFPLVYAFSENYVLPVSHDEVVHGKRSLISKMYGDYDAKFAQMRVFLANMMTLPGKKLTFMGTEFAQFREWDYQNQLEWFLLDYPRHAEMKRFAAALNELYLASPALWELDDSWEGFCWIDADMARDNLAAYRRFAADGSSLAVVLNYSAAERRGYGFTLDEDEEAHIVLSSDRYEFGGMNALTEGALEKYGDHICIDVPRFTALIIEIKRTTRMTKGEDDDVSE